MRHDDYPDVPDTLAVAITLWVGAVAAATQAGIFLRLPVEAYAALAAFALAFALSVVTVDARIRGWLARRGAQCAWLAALGIAAIMVASGIALADAQAAFVARDLDIRAAPWSPILLFGVPATLALGLSALHGAGSREESGAVRRPASTVPARPAVSPSGSRTSAASAVAARARAAG